MRTTVVLAIALALAPTLAPAAEAGLLGGLLPAPTPGTLLVGAQPGLLGGVTSLVLSLGGVVTGSSPEIGVVRASFADVNAALATLQLSSLVSFVEKDGLAGEAGAQWNGAEWNSAEWNGAQWNGAQWNGATASDPGVSIQWGLLAADVPRAWTISAGRLAAPICVLDSGVDYAHPDLAANVWTAADGTHGYDFVHGDADPMDDAGHGTHVAGIAAAVVGNGVGVAGVANEPIMAVKVLDANGQGRESDVAFGLVWCATHGAKVALMSLSADGTRTFRQAIAFASSRDVLLVASAGNRGPCANCVGFPASDPRVLAVGAVGRNLAPASFSSSGPQVALLAPGVDIASTFPDGSYVYGTGTSMAAAWVAGAAALVRDAHPSASAQATRDDLTGHAAAGLLDVRAALAASP